MVGVAEKAAALLEQEGVFASVVNMRWVKPIDMQAIASAAAEHRLIVTIEESTGVGGFGAAVCETLADLDTQVSVLRLAVPDCFVTHGAMSRLLAEIGLTPEGVRSAVLGRLIGVPPRTDGRTQRNESRADDTASDRRTAR
jgi:1-deoxy-D-xylulose-5-phosphate synthase